MTGIDFRRILLMAVFWNVLSNLPFVLAGIVELWRYPQLAEPETRAAYLLLCLGVALVGLGSAY